MTTTTTDQDVATYVAWAQANGRDADNVATLKAYERKGLISRKRADRIADDQYIGGGESDWRSNQTDGC